MNRIRLYTWMLTLGLTGVARAQELPQVAVSFTLGEPVYRASFQTNAAAATGRSELGQFEQDTARALESVLGSHLGFLRFGPGTNAHQLTIKVDRGLVENTATELIPTRFVLELTAPSQPRAQLIWQFRQADEYSLSVVPGSFLGEVTNRFAARLEADAASAVTRLFSRIPVADEVYLVVRPSMSVCVLPFSYEAIKAGQSTGFEFETLGQDIPVEQHHGVRGVSAPASALPNLPALYLRGILAQEDRRRVRVDPTGEPFDHTDFAGLGVTNGLVRGLGLFVTDYVHVQPVRIHVKPSNSPQ